MAQIFDNSRTYNSDDPELDIFGSKQKRAKWRSQKFGPAWIKFGRKIIHTGSDLNAWIESNRTDPNHQKDTTYNVSARSNGEDPK